jgi:hypothetical protein
MAGRTTDLIERNMVCHEKKIDQATVTREIGSVSARKPWFFAEYREVSQDVGVRRSFHGRQVAI